jgi:DNA polymerase kappa
MVKSSTTEEAPSGNIKMMAESPAEEKTVVEHETLKYSLLGPSLTKSGQDNVDQQKAGPRTRR